MSTQRSTDTLTRFRRAAAEDLLVLADLHDRELDRERILNLWKVCYDGRLFEFTPPGERFSEARSLFCQGLTDIPTSLERQSMDLLAAEYADIYRNHGYGVSPCEPEWRGDGGLAIQTPMSPIRDEYRRHRLAVQDRRARADDHLVCQLRFLSQVFRSARDTEGLNEAALFLDEHLLRWIGDFADRISGRCGTRFYAGLTRLTDAYLKGLREALLEVSGENRPSAQAIEEQMRPAIAPPAPNHHGDTRRPR